MYKYQYSGQAGGCIPGVGVVRPDQVFLSAQVIENPNVKYLGQEEDPGQIVGTASQKPADQRTEVTEVEETK